MHGDEDSNPPAAPDELLSVLAANLRRLRAESRWSTRDFADHARLSLATLYGIEHGQQKTVRTSTVVRLAKALGVHVSVLLASRESRRPWSEEDPLDVVAAVLSRRRKAMGFTQEELANKAGVARHIVAKIETHSRNPTIEVLSRLATALGISLEDLLAGDVQAKE